MAIEEFTLQNVSSSPDDLAKKIGKAVARTIYNGKSESIMAGLELAKLSGSMISEKGPYHHGFEIWSGQTHIGDVYIARKGDNAKIRLDVNGEALEPNALLEYFKA